MQIHNTVIILFFKERHGGRKIIGKIKRFAAKDNIDFDDFDRMVELLDSIKI